MNERDREREKQGERDKGRTREKREYHSRAERLKEGYSFRDSVANHIYSVLNGDVDRQIDTHVFNWTNKKRYRCTVRWINV